MKKKNEKLFVVVLNALCAILWIVRVILDLVNKTYNSDTAFFWLNVWCAGIWIFAFGANLKRYLSYKEM